MATQAPKGLKDLPGTIPDFCKSLNNALRVLRITLSEINNQNFLLVNKHRSWLIEGFKLKLKFEFLTKLYAKKYFFSRIYTTCSRVELVAIEKKKNICSITSQT